MSGEEAVMCDEEEVVGDEEYVVDDEEDVVGDEEYVVDDEEDVVGGEEVPHFEKVIKTAFLNLNLFKIQLPCCLTVFFPKAFENNFAKNEKIIGNNCGRITELF